MLVDLQKGDVKMPWSDLNQINPIRKILGKDIVQDVASRQKLAKTFQCTGKLKDGSICGQIVRAQSAPTPLKWKDGHVCHPVEE